MRRQPDNADRAPSAPWGRRVGDLVPPDDRERLDRLADLARHAVAAREEERRRLAAELHDVVGTNLAAIKLNLSSLADALPAGATQRLADTQELLAETIVGIRELCGALRPATLEYAGFATALQTHCARFSRRTGIEVDCELSQYDETPRTPAIELMLLRVAQEALWNSAKHADAQRVRIRLQRVGSRCRFTIQDDGDGFDPAQLGVSGAAGLGILNMRERALSAQAVFSLDSAPGRGTVIAIDF